MTTIQQTFAAAGFTKAGGMWGDAQWKMLRPNLVVSIGESYDEDSRIEYLHAPEHTDWPCAVYIYRGEFWEGWTASDGEPPIEAVTDDNFQLVEFESSLEALAFVQGMETLLATMERDGRFALAIAANRK